MRYLFNETCVRLDEDSFCVQSDNGNEIQFSQLFPISEWDSPDLFEAAGIRGYEPMTAKELDTVEKREEAFDDPANFIEEKFDGTRGLLYFLENDGEVYCRVFSRRISKKTGFYVENTDALPQLRLSNAPIEIAGTVIDGELFIDNRPFKDVSSTLNCLWDKAIDRQIDLGFITFHAFDIIAYRGYLIRNTPLYKRKKFLDIIVKEACNDFIVSIPSYLCGNILKWNTFKKQGTTYYAAIKRRIGTDIFDFDHDTYKALAKAEKDNVMTPQAYYELIVATGGEGVIIKPKKGKYLHKRGWEYSKIKKFLTKELILLDFTSPTREYSGKAPETWEYWEDDVPVTRHWYNKQVGNLVLGVFITKEQYKKLKSDKQGTLYRAEEVGLEHTDSLIMEVCECGGFDDDTREYFTENKNDLIGSVVEVIANEVMKDSGRLRHPRYFRLRNDKCAEQCKWEDHIL